MTLIRTEQDLDRILDSLLGPDSQGLWIVDLLRSLTEKESRLDNQLSAAEAQLLDLRLQAEKSDLVLQKAIGGVEEAVHAEQVQHQAALQALIDTMNESQVKIRTAYETWKTEQEALWEKRSARIDEFVSAQRLNMEENGKTLGRQSSELEQGLAGLQRQKAEIETVLDDCGRFLTDTSRLLEEERSRSDSWKHHAENRFEQTDKRLTDLEWQGQESIGSRSELQKTIRGMQAQIAILEKRLAIAEAGAQKTAQNVFALNGEVRDGFQAVAGNLTFRYVNFFKKYRKS